MIAWERHIDATRDDADALYSRLSAPVTFADGTPSAYGFGLNRRNEFGRAVTGHGGALRGWRSHRLYVPSERVSVVVMFNHLSDAHEAAVDLLAAVLGRGRPQRPAAGPAPHWLGAYRRAGDRTLGAHRDRRRRAGASALRPLPGPARPAGRRRRERRRRAAATPRRRPVDGPAAGEPELAPVPLRRNA